MRTGFRATIGAAVAAGVLAVAGMGTASAQVPKTCTWGGTPLAPTAQNYVPQGLSNTASTQPVYFHAVGPLGGQCHGTMIFDGYMDAGASCGSANFHARVYGLPGIRSVAGTLVAGLSPAKLYDRHGNLVGSENANFLSDPSSITACNTPQGVTHNRFSSLIELFGTHP